MISKVTPNIWKVNADGNVYLLEKEKTVIDAGSRKNRHLLEQFLSKVIALDEVKNVIFTHLHTDHIGNFDLFSNARFFASEDEISDLKKDPYGAILDKEMVKRFKVDLRPISELDLDVKIIKAPGHTKGSICILYEDVLFTGDVIFKTCIGRTDLPTSDPKNAQKTLNNLVSVKYKIMCPGHEY